MEEEAERMIARAEEKRCYAADGAAGHRFCHETQGYITVWAEYAVCGPECRIESIYTHRLVIREEDV